MHTASTRFLTWYYAHKRRGRAAMDEAGILPGYQGCAMHDCLQSYFDYDCQHALCNAHLLRELTFLWEEQKQVWAEKMIDLLLTIKTAVETARTDGANALLPSDQTTFQRRYQRIVKAGYAQNPSGKPPHGPKRRGRRKQSKARNLLDRLHDHSDSVLAFMRDFSIPFDLPAPKRLRQAGNNQSERDPRMMKLKQKISGTFRSFTALENFCTGISFILFFKIPA